MPLSNPPSLLDSFLFQTILELLERLPLPLMLQTSGGQVVAQNSSWCQQITALQHPEHIHQDAASLLTAPPSANSASTSPSYCYLVAPNNCTCVCTLKDGQERVLQLTKISFGQLLPNWPLQGANLAAYAGSNPGSGGLFSQMMDSSAPVAVPDRDLSNQDSSELDAAAFHLAALVPPHLRAEAAPQSQPNDAIAMNRSMGWEALGARLDMPMMGEGLWLVLIQDVTEPQQLARELIAKNADLVQLNRLKDEFLACISHELKTPLTAVLGLSSLLKNQTLGELNQRQVHYAQLIYQSSRHLMSVVNDILDLTQIETGQLELLYESVSIAEICTQAFDQAKQVRLIEQSKLDPQQHEQDPILEERVMAQFTLAIEPGLESLLVDELRLRQMLVHLLSNALKFTEVDRPIGLRVGRWGGWVAFTVWDTGIGIAAEKQHLIFQKFQQLENPLTRQFEGAGLGLVLTRKLARLHGGDVTFLSQTGEGSQFTILLPPLPPDKTYLTRGGEAEEEVAARLEYPSGRVPLHTPPEQPTRAMGGSRPRDRLLLIVEGDPHLIETLTHKLTGLGYRVVIARSGTEALEKARRLQPCVIFLNPLLPMLSGWDVLTLLKSNAETRTIPVVITATTGDEAQAQRNHANSFLKLPIQTQALQQILHQVLLAVEETPPVARDRPSYTGLTLLRLWDGDSNQPPESLESSATADITALLQQQHYRILEADDLEQAELLARVWKPSVVVLEGAIAHPSAYLQQLSYHTFLASLPIVTLDAETTQAANQTPGLLIFPCLAPLASGSTASGLPQQATLLQVIQVAAGFVWRPTILAIDDKALHYPSLDASLDLASSPSMPKGNEWLQALMQYLQTAGFQGSIGQTWLDLWQPIQGDSVDLLLICWTASSSLSEVVLSRLTQLAQFEPLPPIIVLDHRYPVEGYHQPGETSFTTPPPGASLPALPEPLHQLATLVIHPPVSIPDLLEHIHQMIQSTDRRSMRG
jgi:signal transduction histidine kinase/CheY-like chemotaxis protein